MSTATIERKTGRLDLRLTPQEKQYIERAASIEGISVSAWSTSSLIRCAKEAIAADGLITLNVSAFDSLVDALEKPQNSKFKKFASEKTIWEA
jgi:uncharacterized protein (DUF1778 family)